MFHPLNKCIIGWLIVVCKYFIEDEIISSLFFYIFLCMIIVFCPFCIFLRFVIIQKNDVNNSLISLFDCRLFFILFIILYRTLCAYIKQGVICRDILHDNILIIWSIADLTILNANFSTNVLFLWWSSFIGSGSRSVRIEPPIFDRKT